MNRYCEIFQLHCQSETQKQASISLEDGGEYFGHVNADQVPDGQGTEFYPNGEKRYEGQFINGSKSGNGSFYYQNGVKAYIGQFQNNHMHGQGFLYDPKDGSLLFEGSLFHGSFYNGTFYN